MSRFEGSIPPTYFDERYAGDTDPWRFASSSYERAKYKATLQALPRCQYLSAFEVGCSIGVLTRCLATRCQSLLAVDVARAALEQAKKRCADLSNTRFDLMNVPLDWPDGRFDLIVLSEVVYYLDRADVARLGSRVAGSAHPGADIILVHWLGETHYPLSGDEAAEHFIASVGDAARLVEQIRTSSYRLDTLRTFDD